MRRRCQQEHSLTLVMCGTILVVSMYLEQEVRTDEQEGPLTSRRRWRCGTTRVCCTGWRSPTLDRSGFAGPNIFATSYFAATSYQGQLSRERTELSSERVAQARPSPVCPEGFWFNLWQWTRLLRRLARAAVGARASLHPPSCTSRRALPSS